MDIKFYAPVWGNSLPFNLFCHNVKEAGYDGIEMDLPMDEEDKEDILITLKKFNLELIAQYWQSHEPNIEEHLANFEKYIKNLIAANPVFINSQTGKDYFTFEENRRLLNLAKKLSDESGVPILHETHRGKCFFAAHVTQAYLMELPDLRLTLDISHWCNVHESLLGDQSEAVKLAILHTDHIHSRVGHQQGPQTNDPRAPEWKEALDAHLGWWDCVVAERRSKGKHLTITTEFGPQTYMPAMPYTQLPLGNQWEINVHMMNLLRSRYKS